MTDLEIIFDWLCEPSNENKIATIAYDEEVYNYVIANMDKVQTATAEFFKVGSHWIKIIKKENIDEIGITCKDRSSDV